MEIGKIISNTDEKEIISVTYNTLTKWQEQYLAKDIDKQFIGKQI